MELFTDDCLPKNKKRNIEFTILFDMRKSFECLINNGYNYSNKTLLFAMKFKKDYHVNRLLKLGCRYEVTHLDNWIIKNKELSKLCDVSLLPCNAHKASLAHMAIENNYEHFLQWLSKLNDKDWMNVLVKTYVMCDNHDAIKIMMKYNCVCAIYTMHLCWMFDKYEIMKLLIENENKNARIILDKYYKNEKCLELLIDNHYITEQMIDCLIANQKIHAFEYIIVRTKFNLSNIMYMTLCKENILCSMVLINMNVIISDECYNMVLKTISTLNVEMFEFYKNHYANFDIEEGFKILIKTHKYKYDEILILLNNNYMNKLENYIIIINISDYKQMNKLLKLDSNEYKSELINYMLKNMNRKTTNFLKENMQYFSYDNYMTISQYKLHEFIYRNCIDKDKIIYNSEMLLYLITVYDYKLYKTKVTKKYFNCQHIKQLILQFEFNVVHWCIEQGYNVSVDAVKEIDKIKNDNIVTWEC
mgnify:CR=1 FL=1